MCLGIHLQERFSMREAMVVHQFKNLLAVLNKQLAFEQSGQSVNNHDVLSIHPNKDLAPKRNTRSVNSHAFLTTNLQ